MFNKARLKLTTWYLVIIFLITSFFSAAVYQASTREIRRMMNRIQIFHQEWNNGMIEIPPRPSTAPSPEEFEAVQQRLLINLVAINVIILILTGGAAYFLAGKTLKPIQLMLDEQNQFISNSSHQLRTPLATLRAEMEGSLLEKHFSDQQARQLIMSNLEEVNKLQSLSNKLLHLAKLHDPSPIKYSQLVSLSAVVQNAVKQVKALAASKKIKIKVKVSNFTVQGDQESLKELFVILLDNAIKYSNQATEINITSKKNDDWVSIMVKDQGIGIAQADLPFVFKRFFRSNQQRSSVEGFGLGLAIAKQIIDKHGGVIKVSSQLKHGSAFTVKIPLLKS